MPRLQQSSSSRDDDDDDDLIAAAVPSPPRPNNKNNNNSNSNNKKQHHDARSIILNGHDQVMGHDSMHSLYVSEEHLTLRKHPFVWAAVGVIQTFLTAIMFGWASLVPVIRSEMSSSAEQQYTPTQFSQIFTCGAVGNYLATLPFGILLDVYGPKICGVVASVIYAIGLFLCGYDTQNFYCFAIGFGLVGLSRPGIQMPTLHLANLFDGTTTTSSSSTGSSSTGSGSKKKKGKGKGKSSGGGGGGTGGALYMSAQAAAFDAGTAIFALMNVGYFQFGISSGTMFRMYMVVPLWTLLTSIYVWPNETLEKGGGPSSSSSSSSSGKKNSTNTTTSTADTEEHDDGRQPIVEDNDDDDDDGDDEDMMMMATLDEMDSSIGSPYFSPKQRKMLSMSQRKQQQLLDEQQQQQRRNTTSSSSSSSLRRFWNDPRPSLVNAPLSQVLTDVSFYALSTWVGIHIYKLNFIVATINDQLARAYDEDTSNWLINVLGAMLPFGFVVLPIVATLLHHRPMVALQVANVVGIIYGGVMVWCPQYTWLQILVVFPSVATSRQLVYSTLFHTIAKVFGFSNYGVLLGLTNAIASLFQTLQTPMVDWSENEDSYWNSNLVLWASTVPLLFTVLYSDPVWTPAWDHFCCGGDLKKTTTTTVVGDDDNNSNDDDLEVISETSKLLPNPQDPSIGGTTATTSTTDGGKRTKNKSTNY
eukprot:CAMPEP_0113496922 /NCGR_PEP_ID=MMETSP0014_2-20120614/30367_1 /TAXON_ID=2857 /ORGANISM="Nitzschia sp." /LENGTH=698 /DNA_ID=CAMNT_0000390851 /DNA_START=460 /DNA_END=2556 /DNA_ORIENTATION=+ /assembly_acc=CAM_ASM_000159